MSAHIATIRARICTGKAQSHTTRRPHAVILCCQYGDVAVPKNVPFDPEAKPLWFAHQLSDNACATLTILNVLLNCETARIGGNLELFKGETIEFDPVVSARSSAKMMSLMHFR